MPHTRATGPSPRRPRVPLGMFFTRPGTELPAWHGLHPADVAVLVRVYTRPGDLIVDLDAHPTITAAAHYLSRVPATLDHTSEQRVRLMPALPDRPAAEQTAGECDDGAGLVLATVPRPDANPGDRPALVRALCRWQALLRPGGHLIVVPTTAGSQPRTSHRAAIIAAAGEAGLCWQQHLLIVAGLPTREARTESAPTAIPARLLGGRHIAAHRTPLVFTTIAPEATHA